ncbi:MAG: VOC family protein [Burkholderiaceae bacterium]|nr:VOC family protein [Rhodoferax sp.]MCP5262075.1 VOC family protein [Rhodoferax sp.]MCW5627635.1 VOC family protein [Rhodoferax sp.]
MQARISLITLGVADLERAVSFYRDGLGWATEGIVGTEFEHGAVAFFELQGGLRLGLFGRANLLRDAGLPAEPPSGSPAFSLAHNLGSRAAVDRVMAQAATAGARIVKPAQQTFWGGHAGCFQDPDGHLWEVAWNPAWEIAE